MKLLKNLSENSFHREAFVNVKEMNTERFSTVNFYLIFDLLTLFTFLSLPLWKLKLKYTNKYLEKYTNKYTYKYVKKVH